MNLIYGVKITDPGPPGWLSCTTWVVGVVFPMFGTVGFSGLWDGAETEGWVGTPGPLKSSPGPAAELVGWVEAELLGWTAPEPPG